MTLPNNLYAPVEHDGGTHGDFIRTATRRRVHQHLAVHSRILLLAATGALALAVAGRLLQHRRVAP